MSISSVQHAEKAITKKIANGPFGDEYLSVTDTFFYGRRPSNQERKFFFEAMDNLEKRHIIYVRRDSMSGVAVQVEKYDCSKSAVVEQPQEIVKPKLHMMELAAKLHDIITHEAGDNGYIRNGSDPERYQDRLHKQLAKEYDVSRTDVGAAFAHLCSLDLRGHARSLYGAGMTVSDITNSVGERDDCAEELQAAQAEITRLESEARGLLSENQTLTEEIERQNQSIGDLRLRNNELVEFKTDIMMVVTHYNKNT